MPWKGHSAAEGAGGAGTKLRDRPGVGVGGVTGLRLGSLSWGMASTPSHQEKQERTGGKKGTKGGEDEEGGEEALREVEDGDEEEASLGSTEPSSFSVPTIAPCM